MEKIYFDHEYMIMKRISDGVLLAIPRSYEKAIEKKADVLIDANLVSNPCKMEMYLETEIVSAKELTFFMDVRGL